MTDAAVATPFTRVTDLGRQMLPGISCKPAYCTHHYSGSVVGHQFSWTGKIPISRVRLNPPTQLDQTLAQDQFKIAGSSNELVGISGALSEHQAVLCRRTGKIYWRSEYSGLDELNDELPDDVEDDENYVAIPDKRRARSRQAAGAQICTRISAKRLR
jgi:hypothetical protein